AEAGCDVGSEGCRGFVRERGVWSAGVVIGDPFADCDASLGEPEEQRLVQEFVAHAVSIPVSELGAIKGRERFEVWDIRSGGAKTEADGYSPDNLLSLRDCS